VPLSVEKALSLAQDWKQEINRILVMLLAGGAIGFLFGNITFSLVLTLFLYIAYSLIQLRKLNHWLSMLQADNASPPPESSGYWEILSDDIFKLHQDGEKARKELQHTLDRAQSSVSALDIGVVLIDRTNSLEWWNRKAELLLGIKFPIDRGQNAGNLIRNPAFTRYFSQQEYSEPLVSGSPLNSNTILEFSITRFGHNEKLLLVRDITQMHKLEMMRKDFVGNVSHELRTPITVISGYLENLIDNRQILDKKWAKAIEQMHQQSQRVENILRDLLILSRLETRATSTNLIDVNVGALLNEVKNDTCNIYEDRHHNFTVECDESLELNSDRSELYSAISNLCINAAKYTPDGGNIQLRGKQTPAGIEISVIDNGIGIEPQHIPRLTERFYRVDVSRSSSTGGTGLGLAIVKHILARHGATLHIESQPGRGSRFTCRFPV
jgi:two-component system phosphate regulon sensor histidine kinase PhoR